MKRLLVALGSLLLVVVLCVVSLHMQLQSMDYLMGELDKMQDAYDQGDLETCLKLSQKFVEDYTEKTRFFPFFMRHSDVSKIEETAVTLPILLETGNDDHFAAELVRCKNQLKKLSELETPIPENIL